MLTYDDCMLRRKRTAAPALPSRGTEEALLRTVRLADLSAAEYRRLIARRGSSLEDALDAVRPIVAAVRARGDAALREYTERFDGVRLDDLRVGPAELDEALAAAPPDLVAALRAAAEKVRVFHRAQLERGSAWTETTPGVAVWRAWRPIERVGIYAPGGRAAYPSSVLMQVVPAQVAGCSTIVVCTPPDRSGRAAGPVLAAARLLGVEQVYRVGGAQAIAALAFGTETVPRVDKIFGPGNRYVAAAKLAVSGAVAVDLPAGPSEVVIIASGDADPRFVAADLLAQAEHGPDSVAVLISDSPDLVAAALGEVERQTARLERAELVRAALRDHGLAVIVDDLAQAFQLANDYAPEHAILMLPEPRRWLDRLANAASVFLGRYAPAAAGDYATGANHVLPTGGLARSAPPLGIEAFGRWVQVQELTQDGLARIEPIVSAIARAEGLTAHAASVRVRLAEPDPDARPGAEGERPRVASGQPGAPGA
jgi:histidinol dehydrogenase